MTDFIVLRSNGRYVQSISNYDGDVEDTPDRANAKIFHGEVWVEHWTNFPGYTMIPVGCHVERHPAGIWNLKTGERLSS